MEDYNDRVYSVLNGSDLIKSFVIHRTTKIKQFGICCVDNH
jgi:hypothetical protein